MGTFRSYVPGALPTPPNTFDYSSRVLGGFPMADNDRLGCCTYAGVVHLDQLVYAEVGENFAYPGDHEVEVEYLDETGGEDTGCVEVDVLEKWRKDGLFGTKLLCWTRVDPQDHDEVRAALWLTGGLYLGVELPGDAEGEFANHVPWTVANPPSAPVGGHCIVGSGASDQGLTTVTWGALQSVTWDWIDTYCSEMYVVVPEVFGEVDHAAVATIDTKTLIADLNKL